ncbi:N-acetylmuramoyl-L-alanine amidase [bacterium]|nr:N-acetylmuramoyl-L-alanine amidase [bacterium]
MRVCLDPGHGHKPTGATGAHGNGITEDNWALNFALRLGHYLRAMGARTVFTREGDSFVSLQSRAAIACKNGCDLFLSIHLNAGPSSARGAEAFIAAPDKQSGAAAKKILHVIGGQGMKLRGVKLDNQSQHSSLYVLRNTYRHMRAVLVEVGFLTNSADVRMLTDKYWIEQAAQAIAAAILA